jgi:peroxiredoxin
MSTATVEENEPTSSPTTTVNEDSSTVNFNLPDSEGNNFDLAKTVKQKNVVIVFYIGHY